MLKLCLLNMSFAPAYRQAGLQGLSCFVVVPGALPRVIVFRAFSACVL